MRRLGISSLPQAGCSNDTREICVTLLQSVLGSTSVAAVYLLQISRKAESDVSEYLRFGNIDSEPGRSFGQCLQ